MAVLMDVQTPSLLARDAPRSERDPDLQAAATNLAMRPFTGTFADSSHESAFAAQLFRLAFPAHILLMALSLALSIWETLAWPLAETRLGVAFLLCSLAQLSAWSAASCSISCTTWLAANGGVRGFGRPQRCFPALLS